MKLASGQRLVIAHNPNSSRSKLVQRAVFDRLDAAGYTYDLLEVRQASLADNVARLKSQIRPGDVIVSAAGDGSAHAIANTVIAANQPDVTLGFLAFGNFNDLPHSFNARRSMQDPVRLLSDATPVQAYPLSVVADGEYLRSSLLYTTVGWTADAAAHFDDPAVRSRSAGGKTGLLRSLWQLGWHYLRSRKESLLPEFKIDDKIYHQTDILVANSTKIARLFATGDTYYLKHEFLLRTLDVRRLLPNVGFLLSGLLAHIRGAERASLAVEFTSPSDFTLQCDGEVVKLEGCSRLAVEKSTNPINVLTTKDSYT